MTLFRILLIVILAEITLMTALTIHFNGWDFLSAFFGDLFSLTWRGQFNLDFLTYLLLSGLWIAWRGGFAPGAIAMGALAAVMGMLVFAIYLLVALQRSQGDIRRFFMGVHAEGHARVRRDTVVVGP